MRVPFTLSFLTVVHQFAFVATSKLSSFNTISNTTTYNLNSTSNLPRDDEENQQLVSPQEQQQATATTYYVDETIASLTSDEHGNITKCQILKAHTAAQKREAFAKVKANFVSEISFNTMLNIIRTCYALDKAHDEEEELDENVPKPVDSIIGGQTVATLWTAVTGILPGTRWCGLNNQAKEWNDVGNDKEIDKCCRSHDVCPKTVPAFGRNYGLLNLNIYTSSHCDCDAIFYDCLRDLTSSDPPIAIASVLGNFYFNVLRLQCIEEEHPPKCASHANNTRLIRNDNNVNAVSCFEWEEAPSRSNQKLIFREFGNKW